MGSDINNMAAKSGRILKEDSTVINEAEVLEASHDPVSGANVSLSHEHAKIHAGEAFTTCTEFVLSAATPQYIHVRTGAKAMHLKDRILTTNNTDTIFELLKQQAVTVDPIPTYLSSRNSNQLSANTATVQFLTNSAVVYDAAIAKVLCRMKIYGAVGIGISTQGGSLSAEWEIILAPNTDYVIRVYRPGATDTGKMRMELRWYESEVSV